MFRVLFKLRIVPSAFLYIGLLNARPEIEAEFVDFHAGPMNIFVVTLLACVATL